MKPLQVDVQVELTHANRIATMEHLCSAVVRGNTSADIDQFIEEMKGSYRGNTALLQVGGLPLKVGGHLAELVDEARRHWPQCHLVERRRSLAQVVDFPSGDAINRPQRHRHPRGSFQRVPRRPQFLRTHGLSTERSFALSVARNTLAVGFGRIGRPHESARGKLVVPDRVRASKYADLRGQVSGTYGQFSCVFGQSGLWRHPNVLWRRPQSALPLPFARSR
jgi:hypothetical protein